jgi:hypothetical protein
LFALKAVPNSDYDALFIEKEVGLLGYRCKFLVKHMAAFQNKVF